KGVQGFRFFHDHHAAILEHIVEDPRCAKVILTRNPVESYVSWKIAQATGQWKLTNATHHKASQIEFDREEFEAHLGNLQAFQLTLLNALQKSGQTAFYVAYEDIQDIEVMNGLARYLGSETQLEALSKTLKKQNPAPMSDKVANYDAMEASLAALDRFDLTRTPNFEPRRGAVIPTYVAAQDAPLLYMPIRSGPDAQIREWLHMFGGAPEANFTQKTLRQWKRSRKGHRSFTVVRHPVPRAYAAFERHILGTGKGAYLEIRETLMKVFNVPLAEDGPGEDWTAEAQRAAFLGFLGFLKANLGGQTAVRVDAAWASQSSILSGFADFAQPDMVVRESNLEAELSILCELVGAPCPALPDPAVFEVALEDVYDEEIEAAVRDVYQRDYMSFGFGPWQR
ncbi:MAG: sulfotransferase family 2 domain-containing protein, partial [Pseudomonadota bacterium]